MSPEVFAARWAIIGAVLSIPLALIQPSWPLTFVAMLWVTMAGACLGFWLGWRRS